MVRMTKANVEKQHAVTLKLDADVKAYEAAKTNKKATAGDEAKENKKAVTAAKKVGKRPLRLQTHRRLKLRPRSTLQNVPRPRQLTQPRLLQLRRLSRMKQPTKEKASLQRRPKAISNVSPKSSSCCNEPRKTLRM